jgi:hypothetical protein
VIPVLAILKLVVMKLPYLVMMKTIALTIAARMTLDANITLLSATPQTSVPTLNV